MSDFVTRQGNGQTWVTKKKLKYSIVEVHKCKTSATPFIGKNIDLQYWSNP